MLITTYKEANQLQSSCISLPTVTVPVVIPHVFSVINQVQARDVHLSCVVCVFAILHVHATIACNSACTRQFLKFCTC